MEKPLSMKKSILCLALPVLLSAAPLFAVEDEKPKRTPSPKGAKSYIVLPRDGRTVNAQFKVVFGIKGMGICPAGITAGDGQPIPDTGHHHLLVDVEELPPMDVMLPSDQPERIMHFGKGQTETILKLSPGKHTLQLVFADHAHVPHDPPVVSEKVTVIVR